MILTAIIVAGLVTLSQQAAISTGYRDGNCSASAYLYCDPNANCVDAPETQQYTCQCQANATGDGFKTEVGGTGCKYSFKTCANINDCPQYANCTSEHKCVCNKGFQGDGFTCIDINECPSPLCDPNALCSNSPGSFKCICDANRHYVGDGFTCSFKCGSNNDCDAPRAICNDVNACVCIKGYQGDGRQCTDINECANKTLNNCNANANCINTVGSFKCECKNGYVGNGVSNCTALPKNCKEISNFVNGNKYRIDPDFTGPANAFTVICDKVNGNVVTKVPATGPFPMNTPDTAGNLTILYEPQPSDIKPLLELSVFCYQDISFTCSARYSLLPGMQWTDAYGNIYNNWGSTFNGQCACGELGMCTMPDSACNCDGNQTSTDVDSGRIVEKSKLPVTSLIFSNAFTSRGRVDIQPLICADKPVGLPKDCHDAKFYYSLKKNAIIYIKPDVNGPLAPSLVKCDVETYYHAGITIVPVKNPVITPTITTTASIRYPLDLPRINAIITGSKYCSQYVEFTCKNSKLMAGGGYVSVGSAKRRLDYFPGAAGVQNSCGCGATASCSAPTVKCNCDIGDDVERKDFGIIFNKTDLPIVEVAAEIGQTKSGTYRLSNLQCAGIQFGIPPNCDKARIDGARESYTYYIDPDGPTGKLDPLLAECKFVSNPPQGITIIHHNNEKPKPIYDVNWILTYLQASKDQIESLKIRSTTCTQEISVGCQGVKIRSNVGPINFKGPSNVTLALTDYLQTCAPNGTRCNCNGLVDSSDNGIVDSMQNVPINSIDFSNLFSQNTNSGLTVTVGPLKCSEIFQTCAALQEFLLSNRTAYGESYRLTTNLVTIDPDGSGEVPPMAVKCSLYSTTVILIPPNMTLQTDPTNPNPVSMCYDITYTNENGDIISPAQISALVKRSGKCRQDLLLECKNAAASGNVNYTSCDGAPQKGWAGSFNQDKCACGVNGNCAGGPLAKCNCDMADGATRWDTGTIINNNSLPVCQICFSITPKTVAAGKTPPVSSLKYKLGELVCDGGQGTMKNCQDARLNYGSSVTGDYEGAVALNSDPPVPVGCKMLPNPPIGIMTVKATNNLIPTNQTIEVILNYVTIDINVIIKFISQSEYCSQKLYFFCASDNTFLLGGKYGIYNNRGELSYEWTQIPDSNDAITTACTKNKDLCTRCGRPRGFLLTKKENLPISRISLAGGGATLYIGDVECLDLKKTCHEIMGVSDRKTGFVSGKKFVIDPDSALLVQPFVVNCEFDDTNTNGVTEVPLASNSSGSLHVIDKDGVDTFVIPLQYDGATPEQINALTIISDFCWQGMKYECSYSPIHKNNQTTSYYKMYNGLRSAAFATGYDTTFPGCACGFAGTCIPGYSCNCDAVGRMAVDQGAITNTNALPITGLSVGGQTKGVSSADVRATNVRCSPKPYDPPKQCNQGFQWKSKNGVDYIYSSEYLISPDPLKIKPFMVRCDKDLFPGTVVTIIRPTIQPNTPVVKNPDNPYQIPYYGPTDEQILSLVSVSGYCYQAVKYDCFASTLMSEGNYWLTMSSRDKRFFWGGGEPSADAKSGVCACGKQKSCGGLDSATSQLSRRCNCDAADNTFRSDAGIITEKEYLPISQLWLARYAKFQSVNITVGDLICSETPLTFNECDLGFHDCHPMARCVDEEDGYRCVCKEGWNGKGIPLLLRNPRSNGRECIDDNECVAYEPCPYNANCTNIPGDFYCTCKEGYRQTGKTSCEDIDECADSSLNNCDKNARCENLDGSYRCLCERGYRGDGVTCIPVGECSCFGDTHCISYDNRWLHYQRPCWSIMSQDGCGDGETPTFRVLIQQWQKNNTQPGNYAWVKAVKIEIFNQEIILEQNKRILVNGIATKQYFDQYYFSVISTLNHVIFQSVVGLKVTFNGGDVVQVTVPQGTTGKVCGLCGNYNGQSPDDHELGPTCPDQRGLLTDNEDLFGRSWTLREEQSDVCNVDCGDTKPPVDKCNLPMALIQKECDKLMNLNTSPFKSCLMVKKEIDVEQLRKSCEIDLCYVEDNLDDAICRFAETMSYDCTENEKIEVKNWKVDVTACKKPTCPNNMVYQTCGPAQQETCISKPVQSNLTLVNDTIPCNEGCFCAAGLVMEGDKCIKKEQCGCFYNNGYMATNDKLILSDCSYEIVCYGKNSTGEFPVTCQENEACSTKDGVTGCYCAEGYTMKPGQTTCEPDVCRDVVCSVPNMECVNGTCQCKMGFIGDCNQCEDVDECATGLDNCNMVGQTCINLEGSFKCGCAEGFIVSGTICKDIDECDYGIVSV
ncbi:uncharacterized protein LOC106052747 isoform X2 [Biomphalaria glabrata]|uniref:Uncharacterized protein LOC106052747 isoform X2 n=1 Tax=Biomphalaria glabrata TaxID=6526 RepID=A0A9W2YAY3_BIOGL|nr:uncharacterized protein LOC106052747 isoform X2 [Biomphalaria glabrata]